MTTSRQTIQRRYREKNPETVKLSNEKWKAKDRERYLRLARENARRYRERHPDRVIAQRRARYVRGTEKPHLSDEEKQQIDMLYAQGLNFKEIGLRMNRTGGTVARYLRSKHEIRPRPIGGGPKATNWQGGITVWQGYNYVWIPPDHPMAIMRAKSGYVAEHRLVLAEKLGRALLPHETVHHINGKRKDNRPENLQIRQSKRGKGAIFVCLDCGSHRIGSAPIADMGV